MNELMNEEICLVSGADPGLVGPPRDYIAEHEAQLAQESRDWLERQRNRHSVIAAT